MRFNEIGYDFEVMDEVPFGYEVWNINPIIREEGIYIPFCRLKPFQRFEGGRDIEPKSLKAVKIETVKRYMEHPVEKLSVTKEIERYIEKASVKKVEGIYISTWDDNTKIQSNATVDLWTGEVKIGAHRFDYDFDSMRLDALTGEYVQINGFEFPCNRKNESKSSYWYE